MGAGTLLSRGNSNCKMNAKKGVLISPPPSPFSYCPRSLQPQIVSGGGREGEGEERRCGQECWHLPAWCTPWDCPRPGVGEEKCCDPRCCPAARSWGRKVLRHGAQSRWQGGMCNCAPNRPQPGPVHSFPPEEEPRNHLFAPSTPRCSKLLDPANALARLTNPAPPGDCPAARCCEARAQGA